MTINESNELQGVPAVPRDTDGDMNDDDGTPGKKPPAPSARRQPVTLLLRRMRAQARIEGLNPDLWAAEDRRSRHQQARRPNLSRDHSRRTQMALVPPDGAGTTSEQRQDR